MVDLNLTRLRKWSRSETGLRRIGLNDHGWSSLASSSRKRPISALTFLSWVAANSRVRVSIRTLSKSLTDSRMPGKVSRSTCCWPFLSTATFGSRSRWWRNCGINHSGQTCGSNKSSASLTSGVLMSRVLYSNTAAAAAPWLNPQCGKDPDSVFVLGRPGKRKPPVRKTLISDKRRREYEIVDYSAFFSLLPLPWPNPTLPLVRVNLSVGRIALTLLGWTDNTLFAALDFWVWTKLAISKLPLFSSFSLPQRPNQWNLSKTEFTFHHVGWTVGIRARIRDRSKAAAEHWSRRFFL